MKKLAKAILGEMGKALGMDNEEMTELFDDGVQSMRMNYYPPCPEPQLALGLCPHSDGGGLTIVYQLNETEGLQIISNGVYKSIEHRVTVQSNKERLSVATFYVPNMTKELGPTHSLVAQHKVANFRRVPFVEYYKGFFARKLEGKSNLEFMKLEVEVLKEKVV
ncbi:hypothetical protein L2E82_30825 [Cichorium intybus]|uniref:Uncharacterized protein n=1 Tax=Cichorium intybus TaxID=13427 RepID=A0ACB9D1X0_CICIN|nr:hypothetical protein L2E82_30825 [Cichorium intybus]